MYNALVAAVNDIHIPKFKTAVRSKQYGSSTVPEGLFNKIQFDDSVGYNHKMPHLAVSSSNDFVEIGIENDEPHVEGNFGPRTKSFFFIWN